MLPLWGVNRWSDKKSIMDAMKPQRGTLTDYTGQTKNAVFPLMGELCPPPSTGISPKLRKAGAVA